MSESSNEPTIYVLGDAPASVLVKPYNGRDRRYYMIDYDVPLKRDNEALTQELKSVEARYEYVLDANKGLAGKFKTVEAQLAAFRADNERLEQRWVVLKESCAGHADTIQRLEAQANRQAATIAATSADCAAYKDQMDLRDTETSVALANAQTRIHYLQNELARKAAPRKDIPLTVRVVTTDGTVWPVCNVDYIIFEK